MKKAKLAAIMIIISISLVWCNNSGVSNSGATNESTTNQNTTNQTETNSGITNNEVVGANKITIDQAKEIALNHAKLTAEQVSFIRTESEFDDGIEKYNIEFYYNNQKYDYDINAVNGQIIQYDLEGVINNSQNNLNSTANISIEQAKEIALNHANLTSNQVIFSRTELDYDNGIQKYEVEFYYNNREYSYEINANTGDILGYEQD